MAGEHEDLQGYNYDLDQDLVDDSWAMPDEYSQPQTQQPQLQYGHFMPQQPSYHQYNTPPSYPNTNYGAQQQLQESPYSWQSPYGSQFQHQSHAGSFPLPQYEMNYSSTPSFTQAQQPSSHNPYSTSNVGLGSSTISPQVLQRNDITTTQSYPRGEASGVSNLNLDSRTSTISPQALQRNDLNMSQTYAGSGTLNVLQKDDSNSGNNIQQAWSYDSSGGFGGNNLQNPNELYNQQYHVPQGSTTHRYLSVGVPTASHASQSPSAALPHLPSPSQSSRAVLPTTSFANQSPSGSLPATSFASQSLVASLPRGDTSRTATPHATIAARGPYEVRITHPELVALIPTLPMRIPKYPFLYIHPEPVELDIIPLSKTKKPRAARSKKATIPTASTPKPRPSKSTALASKVKMAGQPQPKDIMSRSIAAVGAKSLDTPSPSLVSSSEEETSSDEYESEDDEITVAEGLKTIRGETRPAEPMAAVAWDAIGIVYVPPYRAAFREEIIKATPEYEKLIGGLREELKSVNSDLSKAETEKRVVDVEKLKDLRATKRKALQNATFKAVEHGHPDILKNLGNSQKLVNSLVSVLIDCIKMDDYVGELPRSVLKLLSRFGFLSDDLLKKVKFDAVEKRFEKKGDAELKGYIVTIRSNTTESLEKVKPAKEEPDKQKPLPVAQEISKAPKQQGTSSGSSTSPLKRSNEGDVNSNVVGKKTATNVPAIPPGQKPLPTAARQTNFFATLNRAGAKPAVKPAAKSATPSSSTVTKKPETKQESAPTSQQSSNIAALLSSIEKPKELPKPVEAPKGPPETPEEKARRERKESRRHLRVKWKEGDALVAIRLFKHDQAEDEGRQDNMLRDAHDDRSEGMMFKKQMQVAISDEDDEPAEIDLRPYPDLLRVDFSDIKYRDIDHWGNDFKETALATRGDNLSFTTPQQQVQQKREAGELMVVYTDPKDIPPSPKEPVSSLSGEPQVEKVVGQPNEAYIVQRLQRIHQDELSSAMHGGNHNLPTQLTSVPDISSILKAMQNGAPHQPMTNGYQQYSANSKITSTTSPNQQTFQSQLSTAFKMLTKEETKKADDIFANIMSTIQPFGIVGKKFPADEPPKWMNDKQKQEWWEGFYRDKSNPAVQQKARSDAARILKMLGKIQQGEDSSYEPPPPQIPKVPTPAFDQSQLLNVVTALNNQTNQSAPVQSQLRNPVPNIGSFSQTQLQDVLAGLGKANQAQTHPQNTYAGFGSQNHGQNTAAGLDMSQANLQNLLASLGTQTKQEYKPQPQVQDPLVGLDAQTQAQLQSYLASLNKPNTQAQPNQLTDYYAAWSKASGGQNYNQTFNPQTDSYDPQNYGNGNQTQTPRWENNNGNTTWKEQQRMGSNVNKENTKRGRDDDHDETELDLRFPPGEARRGKKPCRFWSEGKCVKGIKCGYLHDGKGG